MKSVEDNQNTMEGGGGIMYKLLKRIASLTLLVAVVASKVPCWGPSYQPVKPERLK